MNSSVRFPDHYTRAKLEKVNLILRVFISATRATGEDPDTGWSRGTYTRKNAQVATDLQTSCNKSVHKLFTRCIRTACSEFVGASLAQAVDKL